MLSDTSDPVLAAARAFAAASSYDYDEEQVQAIAALIRQQRAAVLEEAECADCFHLESRHIGANEAARSYTACCVYRGGRAQWCDCLAFRRRAEEERRG